MTLNTSLSGVIYRACTIVLWCVNQHLKFEVPSFTNSKDMIGAQFKTGHVTLTTPFRGLSVIRRLAKIANAFERSGQSLKIAHSPWGSAPHLLRGSLGPPESSFKTACRSVQPFFCTAHRRMCHYIAMGRYVRPPNSHPLTTPRLTTPTKSGAQTGTPSYLWMKLRTWCADRPW